MNVRSWIVCGVLLTSLASAPAQAAPVLLINASGILTGATGVDVGGTLYDVTFVDGTCAALFSGCDAVSDFDFTSLSAANTASQALLDQVFVGTFDDNPSLTFGCPSVTTGSACSLLTPYATTGALASASMARNFGSGSASIDGLSTTTASVVAFNSVGSLTVAWADWTRSPTPVPEPTSLALFGAGLLGLAARSRRPRKRNE